MPAEVAERADDFADEDEDAYDFDHGLDMDQLAKLVQANVEKEDTAVDDVEAGHLAHQEDIEDVIEPGCLKIECVGYCETFDKETVQVDGKDTIKKTIYMVNGPFKINTTSETVSFQKFPGILVGVLDGRTVRPRAQKLSGKEQRLKNFDCYSTKKKEAGEKAFKAYIDAVKKGDIVVIGHNDTACAAKNPISDTVYQAMTMIGAPTDVATRHPYRYREPHIVVGIKGSPPGSAHIYRAERNHHLQVHIQCNDNLGELPIASTKPEESCLKLVPPEPGQKNPNTFPEDYKNAKEIVSLGGKPQGGGGGGRAVYQMEGVRMVKPLRGDLDVKTKCQILDNLVNTWNVQIHLAAQETKYLNFITNCQDPAFFGDYYNVDDNSRPNHKLTDRFMTEPGFVPNELVRIMKMSLDKIKAKDEEFTVDNRMYASFTVLLEKMARDQNRHDVWKDFCKKHLGPGKNLFSFLADYMSIMTDDEKAKLFTHMFVLQRLTYFISNRFKAIVKARGTEANNMDMVFVAFTHLFKFVFLPCLKACRDQIEANTFAPFGQLQFDLKKFSGAIDDFAITLSTTSSSDTPRVPALDKLAGFLTKIQTALTDEAKGIPVFTKFYDDERQKADELQAQAATARPSMSAGRDSAPSGPPRELTLQERLAQLSKMAPRVALPKFTAKQSIQFEMPRIIDRDPNGDYMILYKPCGWVCQTATFRHPGKQGHNFSVRPFREIQATVANDKLTRMPRIDIQEWIAHQTQLLVDHPDLNQEIHCGDGNRHSMIRGLAHRLDAETSGCLVVGNNRKAFVDLRLQCEQHYWNKQYLCLVYGRIPVNESIKTITAKLAKVPKAKGSGNVSHVAEVDNVNGEFAETRFQVMKYFAKDPLIPGCHKGFTMVRCRIMTGRTHQIRKHMEHIGHPIMSDFIYADSVNCMATQNFCPRVFLHHFRISIPKPCSDWKIYTTHSVDLPPQLQHVIKNVLTEDEHSNKLLKEHMDANKAKLDEMFNLNQKDSRESRRSMEADFHQSKSKRRRSSY